MSKNLRETISDLHALAKIANSENAEKIYKIIEGLQSLEEHSDEQNKIYMKISRSQ
jgi:hypothetical protein